MGIRVCLLMILYGTKRCGSFYRALCIVLEEGVYNKTRPCVTTEPKLSL